MAERINVLVVDDDPMILDGFRDYFGSQDRYKIVIARDGHEAFKICSDRKVDFCFTDLNMPGMDGIELAGRIRDIDNTIPVVVMTGYPSSENAIAVLKTGGVDFLVKPFRFDNIGAVIQNALAKRDLFVENMLLKEEIRHKERLSRINQELCEKIRDLNALNLILEKIDWAGSSSRLFDRLVQLCTEITGGDKSYFHLLEDLSGVLNLVVTSSGENDRPALQRDRGVQEILSEKMKDGMPLLMSASGDDRMKTAGIRSLIACPLKIRGNPFGVVSAIKLGTDEASFTQRDLYYLNFMARRAAFVIENAALYENIYENLFATLYAFVEAIEARDPYTKQHSARVSDLALAIGTEMGCPEEALERLRFSGYLHDIGKIGIPDRILLKPGRLTEAEFEVIKKHPTIGANIIGHLRLLSEEQQIIRHHHERWDGSGYPDGLKDNAIPLLSRILAVADVYHAMASDRAYRKRVPAAVIVSTIRDGAGTRFDQAVVEAFLSAYAHGKFSENNRIKIVGTKEHAQTRQLFSLHKIHLCHP